MSSFGPINPHLPPFEAPSGVELAVRERDGRRLVFVLNHSADVAHIDLPADQRDLVRDMPVTGRLSIAPFDVRILARA